MKTTKTDRGFVQVWDEKYKHTPGEMSLLISESSAVGDYEDSLERPGSSYLWVGLGHHLNREEVQELITRMQTWVDTGRLKVDDA